MVFFRGIRAFRGYRLCVAIPRNRLCDTDRAVIVESENGPQNALNEPLLAPKVPLATVFRCNWLEFYLLKGA